MKRVRKKVAKLGWLGILGLVSGLAGVLGVVQGCGADYGPLPLPDRTCTKSEDCTQKLGPGWYCDEAASTCVEGTADAGN